MPSRKTTEQSSLSYTDPSLWNKVSPRISEKDLQDKYFSAQFEETLPFRTNNFELTLNLSLSIILRFFTIAVVDYYYYSGYYIQYQYLPFFEDYFINYFYHYHYFHYLYHNIIINTSTFILDNIINLFGSFLSPLSFLFKYYILSFILYFWGFFFYMGDNNENRATAACFVLSLPHFYFRSKLEILYRYWYYNFIACKFLARNSPLYCVRGENKLTCLRTYQRVKRSWTICNCLFFFLNPFFCN